MQNPKVILSIIAMTFATVQCITTSSYADCWGVQVVNCQFGGPAYYKCAGVTYPIMMFENSGTYDQCVPAYNGLDSECPLVFECTWQYSYVCEGALFTLGPNSYNQEGCDPCGAPCVLGWLGRPNSVVVSTVVGK
jgi:hypothetical protein